MEENIKITIEGDGLLLVKQTTLQKAGQIISFLALDKNTNQNNYGVQSTPQTTLLNNPVQPKEIIINSTAKTFPQKITALAVYIRDQRGQPSFTSGEIKVILKKMGDEPKNLTRDLKTAVELKYIMCLDVASDLYELTDTGSDEVKNKFSGNGTKKRGSSKRSVFSKGISDEIKSLKMVGVLEGFTDYRDLPTNADKILWLMQYAYVNGISAISPLEVEHMSSVLREKIVSGGFTSLNQRNVKKSFVAKVPQGFEIQDRGTEHLKSLVK